MTSQREFVYDVNKKKWWEVLREGPAVSVNTTLSVVVTCINGDAIDCIPITFSGTVTNTGAVIATGVWIEDNMVNIAVPSSISSYCATLIPPVSAVNFIKWTVSGDTGATTKTIGVGESLAFNGAYYPSFPPPDYCGTDIVNTVTAHAANASDATGEPSFPGCTYFCE